MFARRFRLRSIRKALKEDSEGKMSAKEFVVFAVIVFFGLMIGGWIVQLLGIAATDLLGQLLAFMIPTLVVYVAWKKLGERIAK